MDSNTSKPQESKPNWASITKDYALKDTRREPWNETRDGDKKAGEGNGGGSGGGGGGGGGNGNPGPGGGPGVFT